MLEEFEWGRFIPWTILGILIVVGGLVGAADGLPWETRTEASMHDQLLTERLNGIISAQQTQSKQLEVLTTQVGELENLNAKLQTRIDDFMQDTQRKQLNNMEQRYHAQKFARELDNKHYKAEMKRLNEGIRDGQI